MKKLRTLFVVGVALLISGCLSVQPATCLVKVEAGQTAVLHAQADETSTVVYQLVDGEKVTLLSTKGDWRKVRTKADVEGWLPAEQFCSPVGK